jgi:hypothetical protein
MGLQAKVDGLPTYAHADTGKHDLPTMLRCCEAEEANYWKQPTGERLCAAPFYFLRVAILSRKAKDYASEISACERWQAIADDYAAQPMVRNGLAAKNHLGPSSENMKSRLPKARNLLKASR